MASKNNLNSKKPTVQATKITSSSQSSDSDVRGVSVIFFIILVIAFVVVSGWLYSQWQAAKSDLEGITDQPARIMDMEEIDSLVNKVAGIASLPAEKPYIAQISNADQIKKYNSFFKEAKNGQYFLAFSEKAYIYDEQQNILVNVAPISFDIAMTLGTIEIEVRNGTETKGLAGEVTDLLKENKKYILADPGNAEGDYEKTVVIDLTDGEKQEEIEQLIKVLGLETEPIKTMVEQEDESEAEVLVIIGEDYVTE